MDKWATCLVMVLDLLTRDEVTSLNLATGVPMVFKLNADSTEVPGNMSSAH